MLVPAKRRVPVSVVIPCYRCGDTITRAIESVAHQTWLPREVIVVDDASDDDTPEVLARLQAHYGADWLRIIRLSQNQGPGAARNQGWEASTQPFLAFLDADDAWHPRKIEIQLQYMQAHPKVVLTGHRSRWLREGTVPPPLPTRYTIRPITRWQLLLSNCLGTRTVMLKRELDLRFDPTKKHAEDYLLWLQIICRGYKVAFIDLDLAYLYKAPYGAGGLSGQLWAMEQGELDTYQQLYEARLISWPAYTVLRAFSLAKYARRLALSWLRRLQS